MPLSAFYALELLQYALGKCVHANSTPRGRGPPVTSVTARCTQVRCSLVGTTGLLHKLHALRQQRTRARFQGHHVNDAVDLYAAYTVSAPRRRLPTLPQHEFQS